MNLAVTVLASICFLEPQFPCPPAGVSIRLPVVPPTPALEHVNNKRCVIAVE